MILLHYANIVLKMSCIFVMDSLDKDSVSKFSEVKLSLEELESSE